MKKLVLVLVSLVCLVTVKAQDIITDSICYIGEEGYSGKLEYETFTENNSSHIQFSMSGSNIYLSSATCKQLGLLLEKEYRRAKKWKHIADSLGTKELTKTMNKTLYTMGGMINDYGYKTADPSLIEIKFERSEKTSAYGETEGHYNLLIIECFQIKSVYSSSVQYVGIDLDNPSEEEALFNLIHCLKNIDQKVLSIKQNRSKIDRTFK